ncbi:hypothetical protein [Phocaeicola abscessus]|uniref:hypothetical protein n=1 Tax=Phocaeicola abscessus TaxID=555313 RepID=UPI0018DC49F0|nr:hypothetical protein [Phocaeicola abscessus]
MEILIPDKFVCSVADEKKGIKEKIKYTTYKFNRNFKPRVFHKNVYGALILSIPLYNLLLIRLEIGCITLHFPGSVAALPGILTVNLLP